MPLSPSWRATKLLSCRLQFRFISTVRRMLGRSKPSTNCATSPPNSCSTMSARVTSSAVAVSATMGVPGNRSRKQQRSAYSGRKAGPHCEMQCASSMAKRRTGNRASASSMRSVISRSGAM